MFGFQTVEEFYSHSASCLDLPNIKVPTLAIHAIDDPILLARNLPFEEVCFGFTLRLTCVDNRRRPSYRKQAASFSRKI